jgi:hypothetical protein
MFGTLFSHKRRCTIILFGAGKILFEGRQTSFLLLLFRLSKVGQKRQAIYKKADMQGKTDCTAR